jgi:hypothetical protein
MGRERSWNGFDVNCTQSAAGTKSGVAAAAAADTPILGTMASHSN